MVSSIAAWARIGLCVALACGYAPSASAGCKIEVATNDFTGTTERVSVVKMDKILGEVRFVESGGAMHAVIPLFANVATDLGVPGGSVIQMKLEDGQMLELTSSVAIVPETFAYGAILVTRWKVELPITTEQLHLLAGSKLKAVNLPLVQPRVIDMAEKTTYAINKTVATAAQKAAACLETPAAE